MKHRNSRPYVKVTLTLLLVSASIFAQNTDPLATTSETPSATSTAPTNTAKPAEVAQPKALSKEHTKYTDEERPHFQKIVNLIRRCQDDSESEIHVCLTELENCLKEHPDLVYRYNDRQETLLIIASKFGRSHVAKSLIEHGADVNFSDPNGNTPLLISIKNYNSKSASKITATIVILLTLGADIDHKNKENYDAYQLACTLPRPPLTILNILSRYYGRVHHLTTKLKYR